jgi:hypothetical protein
MNTTNVLNLKALNHKIDMCIVQVAQKCMLVAMF